MGPCPEDLIHELAADLLVVAVPRGPWRLGCNGEQPVVVREVRGPDTVHSFRCKGDAVLSCGLGKSVRAREAADPHGQPPGPDEHGASVDDQDLMVGGMGQREDLDGSLILHTFHAQGDAVGTRHDALDDLGAR